MSNITRIDYNGKEIILLATAHVSKQSAIEVRELIEKELPDSVCVELDNQRYNNIQNPQEWSQTDLIKIIKEKKTGLLLVNLILSAQQKKFASDLNTKAGAEFIEAINIAKENNIKLVFADRNINTTFTRIYRSLGFFEKVKLLTSILFSSFSNETTSEEEIEKMKSQDILEGFIDEMDEEFPTIKKILVDERDQYLCSKIQTAPGPKVVAVLGAAHTVGIKKIISIPQSIDGLDTLPTKKSTGKIIGWSISLFIIGMIVLSFFQSKDLGVSQITSWILWNGSFAALGSLLVLAHPLTILAAFVSAPITSLSPLVGVGFVTGIVEALVRKPKAKDIENLSTDINSLKGFFRNRITRILLVVLVSSLFSAVATFIGGTDIFSNLFKTITG